MAVICILLSSTMVRGFSVLPSSQRKKRKPWLGIAIICTSEPRGNVPEPEHAPIVSLSAMI